MNKQTGIIIGAAVVVIILLIALTSGGDDKNPEITRGATSTVGELNDVPKIEEPELNIEEPIIENIVPSDDELADVERAAACISNFVEHKINGIAPCVSKHVFIRVIFLEQGSDRPQEVFHKFRNLVFR